VGDAVGAVWSDGNWYLAKVTGVRGERFDLEYADGDKGTVLKAGIRRTVDRPEGVVAGDRVVGVWKEARMYPGSVQEVTADGVVVKWDDGSAPTPVAFGKFFKE
jgi:hypothetical protein